MTLTSYCVSATLISHHKIFLALTTNMGLSEAIVRFAKWKGFKSKSTGRSYGVALSHFCVFMKNCNIEAVRLDDVMEWFEVQKKSGFFDDNYLALKRTALYEFFSFYKKDGYNVLHPDLLPSFAVEEREPRTADPKTYKKLLTTFKTKEIHEVRNLAFIGLLHDTGTRIGELLAMDCPNLDLKRKSGIIKTEKVAGHPARQVFWTSKVNKWIKQWLYERDRFLERIGKQSEAVFITLNKNNSGGRMSDNTIREMLRIKSREAGIPYMNPHSYRHLLGHDLAKQGANNSTISSVLGHRALASSFIYTKLNDKEKELVVRRVRK